MSLSHVWPKADAPPAAVDATNPAPDSAVPALPDALALVAGFAPELSRLFGYRIGLRPLEDTPGMDGLVLAEVGRLSLPGSGGHAAGHMILAIDRASLSRLLDRMFGARPDAGPPADMLARLPPQSGSWLSLARLLGDALARAIQAGSAFALPGGSFAPPSRVAPLAEQPADGLRPQDRLLFRLDSGGDNSEGAGLLLLRRVRPAIRASATPPPAGREAPAGRSASPPNRSASNPGEPAQRDEPGSVASQNWGRRARDFALDIDFPVSVQVGEIPLSLEDIAGLQAGDILPLARPRTVSVLVSGQPLASMPAASLDARRRASDTPEISA